MDCNENAIEWYTGKDRVTLTLTQKKYINRVKRMEKKHPDKVEIIAENLDGSIVAHMPLSAVHLTIYDSKPKGFGRKDEEDED